MALLKTAEFSRGITFAVAAVLPVALGGYFGALAVGISMAIGVLLSSPSDVPGSLRRRNIGVFFSVLMAVSGTLAGGYAAQFPILFLPVLALLVFGFSMISVFGFRASLISFSGLFAVVLSLAKITSQTTVLEHALLVGAGGIWYLLLSVILGLIKRRRETELLLAEGLELTSEYLDIRNMLLVAERSQRENLQQELAEVQSRVNEKHEIIREVLISRRKNSGRSGVVRKNLLILMDLVDILELAMANPVNYERMNVLFKNRKEELEQIRLWSELMATEVRTIASLLKRSGTISGRDLKDQRDRVWKNFEAAEKSAALPEDREFILVYRNLLVFKEKQYHKILSIMRLLSEKSRKFFPSSRAREAEQFLTTQEYHWKTIREHLDLDSPIFRHALRLTVVLVVGYFLGRLFHFQNSYWILLTSLVIMRPGYALTRDRFKQRLYGTLIGGAIAVSVVLLVQDKVVYAILSVITLVLAFSMIQRNYKTAAAFITLNVVFIYSLLRPDALTVIQFRVLDTLMGAGLAFLGNKFLWPTWEYKGIRKFIAASVRANAQFLKEIENYYLQKGKLPISYRLARKQAFLKMGDLSAAFQRMAQEPKSGEEDLEQVFRLVSLNQEILSSMASLGTFIRAQHTTTASNHFRTYVETIGGNLSGAASLLEKEQGKTVASLGEIEKASDYFKKKYQELSLIRSTEKRNESGVEDALQDQFQEVQVIGDQLRWMLELSQNLLTSLKKEDPNRKPPL